jgi:uncharacterized integral membrane protein
MVIKNILTGYAGILKGFLIFLALMAVCVGTGFLVVFPLWKLASAKPDAYTILCGTIIGAVIAFFAGRGMIRAFRADKRRFFISLARKLTLVAGICVPTGLVLASHRIAAGIALFAAIGVYGYLAFGLSSQPHK